MNYSGNRKDSELKAGVIVLIGEQRVGSTALQRAFSNTGLVDDFSEIFHTEDSETIRKSNFFYWLNNTREGKLSALIRYQDCKNTAADYLEYLQDLSNRDYILLDIKYPTWNIISPAWHNQFRKPVFMEALQDREAVFIQLSRANLFSQFVSLKIAQATNKWHENVVENFSFSVDCKELEEYLEINEKNVEFFYAILENYPRFAHLRYEMLYDVRSESGLARYFFERVRSIFPDKVLQSMSVSLSKNKYVVSDVVTNRHELLDYFANTRFLGMILSSLGQ